MRKTQVIALAIALLALAQLSSCAYYQVQLVRANDSRVSNLTYDNYSTSYKDFGLVNPDLNLRICASSFLDLQGRYVMLAYANGNNSGPYIPLEPFSTRIDYVPPDNCVNAPLLISSFKAWYPSIPFAFISSTPDMSGAERIKLSRSRGWMAGNYTATTNVSGNNVTAVVHNATDSSGNLIVPALDYLVVGLLRSEDNITTTDNAITRFGAPVNLTLGAYTGNWSLIINGIGPDYADTTPPYVSITVPVQDATYSSGTSPFIFVILDDVAVDRCWYLLDGARTDLPLCNESYTLSFGSGTHSLTLYANDTSNNLGSDWVSFNGPSAAPPSPPPSPPTPSLSLSCSINQATGLATLSASESGASIMLVLSDPYEGSVGTKVSDAQGKAEFALSKAGRYTGTADKPGFLAASASCTYSPAPPPQNVTPPVTPPPQPPPTPPPSPPSPPLNVTNCTSDSDCAGTHYCDKVAHNCEPLTGDCGYAENHFWFDYECCKNKDCKPGKKCQDHVCVPKKAKIIVANETIVGNVEEITLLVDGVPEPYANLTVRRPNGEAFVLVTDSGGRAKLRPDLQGKYQIDYLEGAITMDSADILALQRTIPTGVPTPFAFLEEPACSALVVLILIAAAAMIYFRFVRKGQGTRPKLAPESPGPKIAASSPRQKPAA